MEPTIAERLDQYPELKRPDGDCIGRITCEYCYDKGHFKTHCPVYNYEAEEI